MRLSLSISMFLLFGPVLAAELPAVDPGAYCQSIAGMYPAGPTHDMAMSGCTNNEEKAQRDLQAHWKDVPADLQASCVQMQSLVIKSYQGLRGCAALVVGDACMSGKMACR